MGYIHKSGPKNRLLSERPRTFRDRKDSSIRNDKYFRQSLEIARISEEKDKQLKDFDQRYAIIIKLFMAEVGKRRIDITSEDFDEKMEEILQVITQGKFFKARFPNAVLGDVRNTILRKVNAERQNKGKSRDDQ